LRAVRRSGREEESEGSRRRVEEMGSEIVTTFPISWVN
jgi:hypothetical protein